MTALMSAMECYAFYHSPHTTYFKVTDMSGGLPDNSVNDITEDPYGFIWFATWNGVARFDGKNMEVFRHQDTDKIPGINMVRALLAQRDGIWVCADAGVNFLRFADNKFVTGKYISDNNMAVRIESRVSNIINADGNIIIQTIDGDLMRLDGGNTDIAKGKIVFRRIATPSGRIYTDIVKYTKGRIMALSNEGITILSGTGDRELHHNQIPQAFDANLNIYCDTINNKVYTGAGIGRESRAFDIVSDKGNLSVNNELRLPGGVMAATRVGDTTYFATDGDGLYAMDADNSFTRYAPDNSAIPGDALYSIHADNDNNVWCGSYRHGVCMLSRDLNSYTVNNVASGTLTYNIVTSIVDAGDKLYIGLDGGGIDVYDPKAEKTENISTRNSSLPGNNIVSMLIDGSTLWAATYSNGLAEISLPSRQITTHAVPSGPGGESKLWVIKDDGLGNIWAGGSSLHTFNKATRQFTPVPGCEGATVMSIVEDGNYMWVGTRKKGVLKINKQTRKIEARFSDSPTSNGGHLPGKHAAYIFIDSRRNLWVNVDNRELCVINADHPGKVKTYGTGNGLLNASVNSITEDARGDLWVGTNDGLYKYIRSLNTFVRKRDSRIPMTYVPNAATVSGDKIYLGTTKGLLTFRLNDPPSLGNNKPVMFTSLSILDSNKTGIPLYASEHPEVELDNGQNFFTVNFSVPEMSNPDQLQFECRLEGLEDVWQDCTKTRSVTYTNVPSGTYTLLVRHTNPDGSWSEPSKLKIKIRSPWYATVPMVLGWIMIAIVLIWLTIRLSKKFYSNKKKTEMAELERDSASKLNEAKLDFYATVSHELRTPCFLISAQIEEIMDSQRQAVPVSTLSGIYRNSTKLNKLINHVIDFRKSDTGLLKLTPRSVELVRFFENLTSDYEQLCRQKSLTFKFEHDPEPIEAYVDSDKLEQIVTNLISNAYKYTPKGGSVTMSLRNVDEENIAITVSDSGIGIMDKLQEQIFKPFFRTERGQAQSYGDGIGLAFVKDLVELHNGTITLDSKINEGSTFTVTIPKNKAKQITATQVQTVDNPERKVLPTPKKRPVAKVDNPTATRSLLIVDDDPDVLDLVSRAFEGDYRVVQVSDGKAGIETASTGDFDVIITDIMMPEADGHELIRAIKGNRKTSNIKIVVLSALASENDMVQALDEGADAFILKPSPLKFLRRKVDGLFESKAAPADVNAAKNMSGQYNREEQKFLLECRRIIDENMNDEQFGIEMLAMKLAMSHSALYKKIRRMTGMSLIEFINDYKIYKAVGMFRSGITNVQRVSDACGFRDVKTFRESFKKKMNMPPKQFVSQINQDEE